MADLSTTCERLLRAEIDVLRSERKAARRALFICASHCQGGHSRAGDEAAEVLGVPFPIRMEALKVQAIIEGFSQDDLWPWLRKMEEDRAAIENKGVN